MGMTGIRFGSIVVLAVVTINTIQCAQNIGETAAENLNAASTTAAPGATSVDYSLLLWEALNKNNDGTWTKDDTSTSTGEAVNTSATETATTEDESRTAIPLSTPPPSELGEGLLVGEDTPVWIAYRPDSDKPVDYTRLEKGIIKEAIDYWLSDKSSGIPVKAKRNIDDYANLDEAFSKYEASKVKRSPSEVVEVSFLVVMDYETTWPSEESAQKTYIKGKILYALAFWNGFNLRLRHVNNPKIRLRIAGIVMGRNKEATPYLRESESAAGIDIIEVRRKMNAYWKNLSTDHTDFPLDSYHCLATMTDSNPKAYQDIKKRYWDLSWEAPPNEKVMLGLTFYDDLLFRSLPTRRSLIMKGTGSVIQFSGTNVVLQRYPSLSPGKPIKTTILPGELVPVVKQCGAKATFCSAQEDDQPCQRLRCANNDSPSECRNDRPRLIGTECSADGKICLDGVCGDKPKLYV